MPIEPPRIPLVTLPTPVTRLERLSQALGVDLWIKRDDLTGLCFGGNNGYIGVNVQGGTPGYYYYWNNLSQQQDISNLTAGTYTLTVTDNNGCTLTYTQEITQPPLLTGSLMGTDVTCYGLNNGSINLTPAGGTPPYTYLWSNGATTQDLSQIPFGSYQVTISDSYQCTTVTFLYISQPSLPVQATLDILDVKCYGDSTGSIDMYVWGGTPPYSYLWNTGQNTPWLSQLFAGNYWVTITDDNGCDTVIYAHVQEGSNLQTTVNTYEPSCYGYCDGYAVANVTSGMYPYTYQWSNGGTGVTTGNLCFGLYILTVTDNNQCAKAFFFVIPEAPEIITTFSSPGIPCNGQTADLTANVTGGHPPFSYQWSTGAGGATISGAVSGTYTVTITDHNNCADTVDYFLPQPAPLSPGAQITHVRCAEMCNGSIVLQPAGGTSPYACYWSGGLGQNSLLNLCHGTYPVTVTDAHMCTVSQDIVVQNLNLGPQITATAENNTLYLGQSTQLNAVSPSPVYTYHWAPSTGMYGTAMQHPTVTPPFTTTYFVTVTDPYGCTSVDSVTVNVLDVVCSEPYIFIPNAFSPNNDSENDILYVYAPMAKDIYLTIYTRWGEQVFVSDDINHGWDGTRKGEPMSPDVFVYYLKVTCQNNKVFEKSGNITLIR